MTNDIKSVQLTASGDVTTHRARLKAFVATPGFSAASVTIRDGGSGGPVKTVINFPNSATDLQWIEFPEEGILCKTSVYATFAGTLPAITFFFEG